LRISLDSNVISALWSAEPVASFASAKLNAIREENTLLICGPVFVELLAHPGASLESVEDFFSNTGMTVDFEITEKMWKEAGRRFSRYANRRRRSGGGHPRRLLADFLIGSYALLNADRLLTFDRERYSKDFPELQLL
jgi:predicted nucleic acid-binding protein